MKRILVTLLASLPLTVFAQDDEASERLRNAELRLEQAAQEIAELSAEVAGDSIKHVVKVHHPGGRAGRAMLGINISRMHIEHDDGTVEKSGIDPDGVVIHAVTPGGPAEEAGLVAGDVILELNGTLLGADGMPPEKRLMSLMEEVTPGDTINLRYRRGDSEDSIQVTTREFERRAFALGGPGENFQFRFNGEDIDVDDFSEMMGHFPGFAHLSKHRVWRGLELVPLTPKLGSYFGADRGLLVVGVPAGEAIALEEGDVILTIAGATPDTVPDAMRQLRFYEPGDEVVMEIRRQKRNKTLTITIPQ